MKINTVAINPNINPNYPDDAPDKMIQKIQELGIDFPYLVDETRTPPAVSRPSARRTSTSSTK